MAHLIAETNLVFIMGRAFDVPEHAVVIDVPEDFDEVGMMAVTTDNIRDLLSDPWVERRNITELITLREADEQDCPQADKYGVSAPHPTSPSKVSNEGARRT